MHFLFGFIEQWLGGGADVLISFFGIFFCILLINAFWDFRIRIYELIVLGMCSIALIFYRVTTSLIQRIVEVEQSSVVLALFLVIFLGLVHFFFREVKNNAKAKASGENLKSTIFSEEIVGRSIRGTKIGVPLVIILFALSVLATGLSAPQVMIGDEVTHFYMLTHQADDLSKPNFYAEIPIATGEIEKRRYPHSFLWHYGGAVIYRLTGGSFWAIQLYQTLFMVQFLTIGYLIARDRQGVESRSALLYVLVLASLPLSLIFSVAFYQDVPMTAQILTAFYLLRRGKWFPASLFLSLAIGFKVTAILFYPAFFLLLSYWSIGRAGWLRGVTAIVCTLLIVMVSTWSIGRAIETYGHASFYPQEQLEKLLEKAHKIISAKDPTAVKKTGMVQINIANADHSARPSNVGSSDDKNPPIIANHPGDLRLTQNYLIYGGVVLWLLFLLGIFSLLYNRFCSIGHISYKESGIWMILVGGSYTLIAALFVQTSPDARFFLPGLPFLLLPFVEKTVCLPRPKVIISIVAVLALLQGGFVLAKTYRLREITPSIKEGISFLKANLPEGRIFMYPEGNYRFFPAQHEWYLGYHLREFWRADNDTRIRLLKRYNVSTVVVKKHLIAPVDDQITNLGVYPVSFVKEIEVDSRFKKTFSNSQLIMYTVKADNQE